MKRINKEKIWQSFGFAGLAPEEYKRRTTAVQLGALAALCGVAYSLLYTFLGYPSLSIAAVTYVVVFAVNLFFLYLTKNYHLFRTSQLLAISFFPVLAQLLIGGFVEGSAVALAAFLSPSGALLFAHRQTARRYFYLFVGLMIAAAFWDYSFNDFVLELPLHVILTFFVINIVSTFSIIYFILESFLKKQEELRQELRQSLENLKAAQAQLIQSEKMASLGELTAGIAHEIQNPLNFVNNFAEVNAELITELRSELQSGNMAEVLSLTSDLEENEQKILHHGRRADAIVKGMLQHSRKSTGQKVPTDLNALVDEYLRLAYHGMRARDKSFYAVLDTRFDERMGRISIVPQDIGRVLLNLFNNAFYAVSARKDTAEGSYQPTVSVRTEKKEGKAAICIRDNGPGIPERVKNKIFQPFFTTKPTGEGTGLGLSLSYDIITKGHGGTLGVESEEGKWAEFVVQLPLVQTT